MSKSHKYPLHCSFTFKCTLFSNNLFPVSCVEIKVFLIEPGFTSVSHTVQTPYHFSVQLILLFGIDNSPHRGSQTLDGLTTLQT